MIEKLISVLTPTHCLSCGQQGCIFCDICKFNIIDDGFGHCLLCASVSDDICISCRKPWIAGARTLGWRETALEDLVNRAKFERSREAARALADMLQAILPDIPEGAMVTTVPTHPAHVRTRGYDFVDYLGRRIANKRHTSYKHLVTRERTTVQRGKDASTRALQAAGSFSVCATPMQPPLIILVDDVVTTGSTMNTIAQKLYATYQVPVFLVAATKQPKY